LTDVVGFSFDDNCIVGLDSSFVDNTNEEYWNESFSTATDVQRDVDVDIVGIPNDDF